MTDKEAVVAQVWRTIQGDTELLVGVNYGEFEDFAIGLMELIMADDTLRRSLPVRIFVGFSDVGKTTETMLAWVSEVARLRQVTEFLDRLADGEQ